MQARGYLDGSTPLTTDRFEDDKSPSVIVNLTGGSSRNDNGNSRGNGNDKDGGCETQVGCTSSNPDNQEMGSLQPTL